MLSVRGADPQDGDPVIICAYAAIDEDAAAHHTPTVVLLDEHNQRRPEPGA